MAMNAVAGHGVSVALACRTFEISETCYRYSPVLSDENEEIADWLERPTANKRNWGFGLCVLYLRNVQGYGWNHKRVYPLADRRLQRNLPRGGSIVSWSSICGSNPRSASNGTSQNHWLCLKDPTRLVRWISWRISWLMAGRLER